MFVTQLEKSLVFPLSVAVVKLLKSAESDIQ